MYVLVVSKQFTLWQDSSFTLHPLFVDSDIPLYILSLYDEPSAAAQGEVGELRLIWLCNCLLHICCSPFILSQLIASNPLTAQILTCQEVGSRVSKDNARCLLVSPPSGVRLSEAEPQSAACGRVAAEGWTLPVDPEHLPLVDHTSGLRTPPRIRPYHSNGPKAPPH